MIKHRLFFQEIDDFFKTCLVPCLMVFCVGCFRIVFMWQCGVLKLIFLDVFLGIHIIVFSETDDRLDMLGSNSVEDG